MERTFTNVVLQKFIVMQEAACAKQEELYQEVEVTHSRPVRSWENEPEPWLSGNESSPRVWGDLQIMPTAPSRATLPAVIDRDNMFHNKGTVEL